MSVSSKGKFVWYELMTSDAKAAESFYRKVVGWGARDAGMGEPYTLFTIGADDSGVEVGGLMATPPDAAAAGAPPQWTGYVAVDDVDAYVKRVADAGGKTYVPPQDIPEVGRFAIVADPQGASFALFKPLREEPASRPAPGTPGTTGWHELHAVDGAAAWKFYEALFGWKKLDAMDMGADGVYQMFEIDGVPAGGVMTKTAHEPVPSWSYYFNVEEIQSAVARVKGAGGQVLNGPMQVPGGSWIVNGRDPQGAFFSIVAPGVPQ